MKNADLHLCATQSRLGIHFFFFYFFFNELDYSLAKARMMGVSYITGRKENKKL